MVENDGFEKVEPLQWKPENDGDRIEGVLIQKAKLGAKQSNAYYIENKEGNNLVWGTAVLDDRLASVDVGDIVKIIYKGKKPNSKGQPTHQFEVYKKKVTE